MSKSYKLKVKEVFPSDVIEGLTDSILGFEYSDLEEVKIRNEDKTEHHHFTEKSIMREDGDIGEVDRLLRFYSVEGLNIMMNDNDPEEKYLTSEEFLSKTALVRDHYTGFSLGYSYITLEDDEAEKFLSLYKEGGNKIYQWTY